MQIISLDFLNVIPTDTHQISGGRQFSNSPFFLGIGPLGLLNEQNPNVEFSSNEESDTAGPGGNASASSTSSSLVTPTEN